MIRANQKGFGVAVLILALTILSSIALVGRQIYSRWSSSNNETSTVSKNTNETNVVTKCVSKPVEGSIIFDVAQPAPFTDPRVSEIIKSINASNLTWRDGSIVKINGKDHSSGKYIAKIEEGSEESAIVTLKNNPNVTFVAQSSTFCPVETKVKVE